MGAFINLMGDFVKLMGDFVSSMGAIVGGSTRAVAGSNLVGIVVAGSRLVYEGRWGQQRQGSSPPLGRGDNSQ
jgi:hypothetical protein